MGVAFLLVVLVVGFLYTNNDPPSRYRQKRSSGWDSYFHVATWGLGFTIIGAIVWVGLFFGFNAAHWVFNKLVILFGAEGHETYLGTWMAQADIHGVPLPLILTLIGASLISYGFACQERDRLNEDHNALMDTYREVAQADGLESLFFDAMSQGLLVLITLKSRKVYVGKVHQPRFIHGDVENVVIIPMISGYRDKDDLSFKEKHSYIEYYREKKISDKSEPLSIYHFRTVIPRSEIDSASLFDAKTYVSFEDKYANGCGVLSGSGVKKEVLTGSSEELDRPDAVN